MNCISCHINSREVVHIGMKLQEKGTEMITNLPFFEDYPELATRLTLALNILTLCSPGLKPSLMFQKNICTIHQEGVPGIPCLLTYELEKSEQIIHALLKMITDAQIEHQSFKAIFIENKNEDGDPYELRKKIIKDIYTNKMPQSISWLVSIQSELLILSDNYKKDTDEISEIIKSIDIPVKKPLVIISVQE